MAHHFEIYRDKADEYRVRFKYNSEVMFSIKKNGPDAEVVDNS